MGIFSFYLVMLKFLSQISSRVLVKMHATAVDKDCGSQNSVLFLEHHIILFLRIDVLKWVLKAINEAL